MAADGLVEADDLFKRSPSAAVVQTYEDTDDGIVSLVQGDRCQLLGHQDDNGWVRVKTSKGMHGFFPASYLDVCDGPLCLPEPLSDSPMISPRKALDKKNQ